MLMGRKIGLPYRTHIRTHTFGGGADVWLATAVIRVSYVPFRSLVFLGHSSTSE